MLTTLDQVEHAFLHFNVTTVVVRVLLSSILQRSREMFFEKLRIQSVDHLHELLRKPNTEKGY